MTACTITHITAESVRYGGGMVLRFYTEDEEQRKWKTSMKVDLPRFHGLFAFKLRHLQEYREVKAS